MSTSVYDARGGMRNVWIITASMTVLAICYTMIIPFLPIYLLELGVPKDDVALWSRPRLWYYIPNRWHYGADLGEN